MDEHEMMAFEYEQRLFRLRDRKHRQSVGTKVHYLKVKIERHRKLSRTYRPPLPIQEERKLA